MTCTLCEKPVRARGWCYVHYNRWRWNGDPVRPEADLTPYGRLMQRVAKDDSGCWLWTGSLAQNGYGAFVVNKKRFYLHRLSYELFVGPIPDGLHIDHLCSVKACVNPEHLEAVTNVENLRRGRVRLAAAQGSQE